MTPNIKATHEQVAELPVIIAHLKRMRVVALLDESFPTNGKGAGLSLGGSDGRVVDLHPQQRTRRRCRSRKVGPRDGTDDRLATVLDDLSVRQ